MYFEAKVKDRNFKVDVIENRTTWKIGIQEETDEWEYIEIPKSDFIFAEQAISFLYNGSSYVVDAVGSGTEYTVYTRGSYRTIRIYNDEALLHESLKQRAGLEVSPTLNAGMPGKIVKIMVKAGDTLKMDDPILIMEAMKMENEMRAPRDLKIKEVHYKTGESVESGATLVTFADEN